jgi:hypothetical protein
VLGVVRLLFWMVMWGLGAYALILHRDALPSGPILFGIQCLVFAGYLSLWTPQMPVAAAPVQSWPEWLLNWCLRTALFIAVFVILQGTAASATDEKWVGMASALPLPGLFALAYLSTRNTREGLRPFRDTVLLGPLLVIPFNYLYAWAVTAFPEHAVVSLLAAWVIGLLVVFLLVPPLERVLDHRRAVQR